MKIEASNDFQISSEKEAAKAYWTQPDTHPLRHSADPHYIEAVATIVETISASSIFEFGCGSGRNLDYLRRRFQESRKLQKPTFQGIDVNPESVEYGRSVFNLEIELGDETTLKSKEKNSFDVVYTVSVLDHIPEPSDAIFQLMELSGRFGIFIEPWLEGVDGQKVTKIKTKWQNCKDVDATPFTYFHNYRRFFEQANCDVVVEIPMPTHLNKVGPFYRLWLVQKRGAAKEDLPSSLKNKKEFAFQITTAAMLQMLVNIKSAKFNGNKEKESHVKEIQEKILYEMSRADNLEKIISKEREIYADKIKYTQERVRGEIRYRIGDLFVSFAKNPGRLPLLPFKLFRLWREYKGDKLFQEQIVRPLSVQSRYRNLLSAYQEAGISAVKEIVERRTENYSSEDKAKELLRVAKALYHKGYEEAELPLAKAAVEVDRSLNILRGYIWAAQRAGQPEAACDVILEAEERLQSSSSKVEKRRFAELKRSPAYQLAMLRLIVPRRQRQFEEVPKRICYVLHNARPYSSGGYATRSHGVASGLSAQGYEVIALTRPGFPLDIKKELSSSDVPLVETVDGITYVRTLKPARDSLPALDYVALSADELEAKFKEYRPEVVIAASNHHTGLMSLIAARRLGIPFIYEVRGLWEVTRSSRDRSYEKSSAFVVQTLLEAAAANNADHVFTLTEAMREELVRRGVENNNITLLPNSCDPARFTPQDRDNALAERLDIPPGVPIIGYVGTFVDYEGLEELAKACAVLKERGVEFRLLLVGNENASGQNRGPIMSKIAEIAQASNFEKWLIMPGRVPHEEVEHYYSLIDIAPFPRKPWPVCEMVSPMKPLEALAMEKAVVVSSVRALAELIENGETGLVFEKGNVASLADTLHHLITDKELRQQLGKTGRQWVKQERTWDQIGQTVSSVISTLTSGSAARRLSHIGTPERLGSLPAWWPQVPEELRDRCSYVDINNWSLSITAQRLLEVYIAKFGHEKVEKRIPIRNMKRADLCCHTVPTDLPTLDIGSGLGEFINLLAFKNEKIDISSVDIKDYDLWLDATGRIERIYKNIFDLGPTEARDVVTCFEVIEHLPPNRVTEAVDILRSLAKKKLFVSVPFMEPLPLYKGHFTRFEANNLLTLFPDAKFTIIGKGGGKDKILAWIMCEIESQK